MSFGHKFRFIAAGGASALPITRAMLLNLYSVATTTTNQARLITATRLKRVRVWGQPPALGATSTPIVVEWLGTNAPSTIHSDSPMGVDASHITTIPPVDSTASWWNISGGAAENEVLFKITGPVGTIIDVDLSLRFADDEAAVNAESGTGAAATVGRVYWNYLDGFASKMLAPVGGVTVLP